MRAEGLKTLSLLFLTSFFCISFASAEEAVSSSAKNSFADEVLNVKGRGIMVVNFISETKTTLTIKNSDGKIESIQKSVILSRKNVHDPAPKATKRGPQDELPPGSGTSFLDYAKEVQRRVIKGEAGNNNGAKVDQEKR